MKEKPPIPFEVMTGKEEVIAHGFLSQETTDLLKVYLPTIEKKKDNPYLFPSNGKSHISDEWLNRLLQRLAEKARIALNGKSLTFHCFRKMLLSASIDSGIGLTAGKKLAGKAIPQSDDTYLTTVNLRKKFIQLKRFQSIKERLEVDAEKVESLKKAINRLQEELTQQRLITNTISEENIKIKQEFQRLQPLVEFVNSFDAPENLKILLDYLRHDYSDDSSDGLLRPLKVEFSPYISKKLKEIAKTMGITEKEALRQLVVDNLETLEKAEAKFKKLDERSKRKQHYTDTSKKLR